MHNFTPEELLLYLYKESSPKLTAAIENGKQSDWSLREKLAVMETAMKRLDKITIEPRTEAVLNVLRYAQQSETVRASNQ